MNTHRQLALIFWLGALIYVISISMLAIMDGLHQLVSHPSDAATLARLQMELNPFPETQAVRLAYSMLLMVPLLLLSLTERIGARWAAALLMALLTLMNAGDALAHVLQGEIMFGVSFLLTNGLLGLLAIWQTAKWARAGSAS